MASETPLCEFRPLRRPAPPPAGGARLRAGRSAPRASARWRASIGSNSAAGPPTPASCRLFATATCRPQSPGCARPSAWRCIARLPARAGAALRGARVRRQPPDDRPDRGYRVRRVDGAARRDRRGRDPDSATSTSTTRRSTAPAPGRRAPRSCWISRTRPTAGAAIPAATPRATCGTSGPTIPGGAVYRPEEPDAPVRRRPASRSAPRSGQERNGLSVLLLLLLAALSSSWAAPRLAGARTGTARRDAGTEARGHRSGQARFRRAAAASSGRQAEEPRSLDRQEQGQGGDRRARRRREGRRAGPLRAHRGARRPEEGRARGRRRTRGPRRRGAPGWRRKEQPTRRTCRSPRPRRRPRTPARTRHWSGASASPRRRPQLGGADGSPRSASPATARGRGAIARTGQVRRRTAPNAFPASARADAHGSERAAAVAPPRAGRYLMRPWRT